MKNGNRQTGSAERHWGLLALIAGSAMLGVMGTVAIMTVLRTSPTKMESGIPEEVLERRAVQLREIEARLEALQGLTLKASESAAQTRRAKVIVLRAAARGNRTASVAYVVSGQKGLDDNQPIVYVDGVRMDDYGEALNSLSPDRIDRVEIVKGEAAKAQYGEEGSNGVVQVFLKSGDDADGEEKRRRRPSRDSR